MISMTKDQAKYVKRIISSIRDMEAHCTAQIEQFKKRIADGMISWALDDGREVYFACFVLEELKSIADALEKPVDGILNYLEYKVRSLTESIMDRDEYRHNSTCEMHNIANMQRFRAKQKTLPFFRDALAAIKGEDICAP